MVETNTSLLRKCLIALNLLLAFTAFAVYILGTTNEEKNFEKKVLAGQPSSPSFSNKTYPSSSPTPTPRVFPTTLIQLRPPDSEFLLAEKRINATIQTSIQLAYQTNTETIQHSLTAPQLKDFLTTSIWGDEVLVVLNQGNINQQISKLSPNFEHTSSFNFSDQIQVGKDRIVNQEKLRGLLSDELHNRLNGKEHNGNFDITALVEDVPATDGTFAIQYIEVDLSQQKLYRWENGGIIGAHIISTGKYGPTPEGIHKIKNKIPNAWSPPAQVWTPYWMAFAYNDEIGAWLGFHELPYWDGPNSQRIRRPFDTLGTPVTGGCIQLNIGDAKELYDWSEVGMPVLIHE